MKHLLFIAVLAVLNAGTLNAQQAKTITGKWKLCKMTSSEFTIDLENPAQAKKEFTAKMKEAGAQVDPSLVEQMVDEMISSLDNMTFDFAKDGKLTMTNEKGKTEIEDYTVDYTKKTIRSRSRETKKVQDLQFRFEGNNLVLKIVEGEKKIEMVLKRVK